MAGTIVADQLQDGAGNSTAMDNAIYGSAKAWVNFNGVSGSVAIRAQYNVSSVTRTSGGTYTVNFTNALTDVNFAACAFPGGTGGVLCGRGYEDTTARTTSSWTFVTATTGASTSDAAWINVIVIR
jgi:hypothetical protein